MVHYCLHGGIQTPWASIPLWPRFCPSPLSRLLFNNFTGPSVCTEISWRLSALGSSSFLYSLISVQYKPSWPASPVSAMSLSPLRRVVVSSLPLLPSCSFSPGFVTFCLAPEEAAYLVEYTQDSEYKSWVWIPVSPLWRWFLKVSEPSLSHSHTDIISSISEGCCEQYMQWLGKAVSKCHCFHFSLFYFPNLA